MQLPDSVQTTAQSKLAAIQLKQTSKALDRVLAAAEHALDKQATSRMALPCCTHFDAFILHC